MADSANKYARKSQGTGTEADAKILLPAGLGRYLAAAVAGLAVLLAAARVTPVSANALIPPPQTTMPAIQSGPPPISGENTDPTGAAHMQQERQRMAEDERRKRIVADTNKLLQLATELKEDVDKSSKNEMSIAVINKAAEIEKLSHDVKERMKN